MSKFSTYKLVLVGESGVGKTTFVKRHRFGNFEKKHIPTLGVEVHPLRFHTTIGEVCFNTWDIAGNPKFIGLADGYYIQGHCAMVFFDVTNRHSFERVPYWIGELRRVCGDDIPIVVIGNKIDVKHRVVSSEEICEYIHANNLHYYDISAKSNYNFEKPFLHLARTLASNLDLQFVDAPTLPPPTLPTLPPPTLPTNVEEEERNDRMDLIISLIQQLEDEGKEEDLLILRSLIRDLTY